MGRYNGLNKYFAAKTQLSIDELRQRIEDRWRLPAMIQGCERKGDGSWAYAFHESRELYVRVTKVCDARDPLAWEGMWGVPEDANVQLIIACCSEEQISAIAFETIIVLNTPLVPYPDGWYRY